MASFCAAVAAPLVLFIGDTTALLANLLAAFALALLAGNLHVRSRYRAERAPGARGAAGPEGARPGPPGAGVPGGRGRGGD